MPMLNIHYQMQLFFWRLKEYIICFASILRQWRKIIQLPLNKTTPHFSFYLCLRLTSPKVAAFTVNKSHIILIACILLFGYFFTLFYYFVDLKIFFSTLFFKIFRNHTRVSNSLDPDPARRSVGPNLGPNCLQGLSVENIIRGYMYTSSNLIRLAQMVRFAEMARVEGAFSRMYVLT